MSRNASFLSLVATLLLGALPARAVYLDAEGTGQILIYPYYTVQASGADAYNTLLSVANATGDSKVIKVRFREGLNGRQVFDINVYLGGGDIWTAAVIPDAGGGARIVSRDASCTNPPLPEAGQAFVSSSYSGANDDGLGTGAGRAREGYFEMIEMATLPAGLTQDATGKRNCTAVKLNPAPLESLGGPSGGLHGNATLININTGLDVSYAATALASVSSRVMYGDPGSAQPDFDSPAIDPVASIVVDNVAYRLVMANGLDAIGAVLAAGATENEYVLDATTASKTDWVETHPLRRLRIPGAPTFSNGGCLDPYFTVYDREQDSWFAGTGFDPEPPNGYEICWAATVFAIRNDPTNGSATSDVLASVNTLTQPATLPRLALNPAVQTPFANGGMVWPQPIFTSLVSTTASTATNLATGTATTGKFLVAGQPVVGFVARTFVNANVTCGNVLCQATYSAALPHRRIRSISPAS